jgi:predicted nucleotidyltransferase
MTMPNQGHGNTSGKLRHQVARRAAVRLSQLPGVVAVALGGSSAVGVADERSDVDLEVYTRETIPLDLRAALAARLADPTAPIEIGNDTWEAGDEWTDCDSGLALGIMYRTPQWIEDQLDRVLVHFEASLGYTTCFWHAVRSSQPLSDPTGWYAQLHAHAQAPYPEPLRCAIFAKNYSVLRRARSSYAHQIALAALRGDSVSLNHRVTALLASYFDILFALNRVLHPGEKRLVEYVERTCPQRPECMAEDITTLIQVLGNVKDQDVVPLKVTTLLDRLDTLLQTEGVIPSAT